MCIKLHIQLHLNGYVYHCWYIYIFIQYNYYYSHQRWFLAFRRFFYVSSYFFVAPLPLVCRWHSPSSFGMTTTQLAHAFSTLSWHIDCSDNHIVGGESEIRGEFIEIHIPKVAKVECARACYSLCINTIFSFGEMNFRILKFFFPQLFLHVIDMNHSFWFKHFEKVANCNYLWNF